MPCPRLQEPGRIGPLRTKNRLAVAPTRANSGAADGLRAARDRACHEHRARGGVAEAAAASEGGRAHDGSLWICHDRRIAGRRRRRSGTAAPPPASSATAARRCGGAC